MKSERGWRLSRRWRPRGRTETTVRYYQAGRRTDRRLRHQDGGADRMTDASDGFDEFDHVVDVLVVGSGGGGMTAALTADASGLDTLVVEKSRYFGGSTALSGGGIWVPGRPRSAGQGYAPSPERRRRIPEADHRRSGQRGADTAVRRLGAADAGVPGKASVRWFEFVWKPGYADYYPELPGGSELGSTINVPPIDLRKLGDDEQKLLKPLALAPKGIWLGPKDLRSFYRIRQSWRGKGRAAEADLADGPGPGVR